MSTTCAEFVSEPFNELFRELSCASGFFSPPPQATRLARVIAAIVNFFMVFSLVVNSQCKADKSISEANSLILLALKKASQAKLNEAKSFINSTNNLPGRAHTAALNISREHSPQRTCRQSEYRGRSEEHTSELQSRENLVCRLLLEKKKSVR